MKKVTVAVLAAGILLGSNVNAYELVTSVYYPVYANNKNGALESLSSRDNTMPWLYAMDNEIVETGYAKNYLNPTFISGIADAFDRELASDDKAVRMAFSKRTLSAVLGFHRKAVEIGESSSLMGMMGKDTDYYKRGSNMIDFLAIPMLSKIADNKETLNEYTTRLRKEAIDRAPGKVWAGGTASVTFEMRDYRFGRDSSYGANGKFVTFPAKVEGVQYNSFVSEFLTLFQEARKLNVEMDVLAQAEKVAQMDHATIAKEVKAFNEMHNGKDDSDTHTRGCYGYVDSQKAVLLQASILGKDSVAKAKEFMDQIEKQHSANITPQRPQPRFQHDVNAEAANVVMANPPVYQYGSFRCHLPALKQLAPKTFGSFEKDEKAAEEPLWKTVILAPLRFTGAAINECQRQGKCER